MDQDPDQAGNRKTRSRGHIAAYRDLPVRYKLLVIVAVTTALSLAVIALSFRTYERSSYVTLLSDNLKTLAGVVGANAAAAVSFSDHQAATELLSSLAVDEDLELAVLYTPQGEPFAHYLRNHGLPLPPAPGGEGLEVTDDALVVYRPIEIGGTVTGQILLRSGWAKYNRRGRQFLLLAVVTFLLAMVLAIVTSLFLFRGLVGSLKHAAAIAGQVATGDLTVRSEQRSADEVGQVLSSIERMTGDLGNLIGRVQNAYIQMTSATNRIDGTAGQLAATASEQAASTNQVVSTATEISATTNELVNTMTEVSGVSAETEFLANSCHEGLGRMEAVLRHLDEATEEISSRLTDINDKAGAITKMVTTITTVADQTNLLSLNAAIEAEKAGEYGRGFAVVAREIRRLADQTAVATLDIERVVDGMKASVTVGVMKMEKFTADVKESATEIRNVGVSFADVIERIQALTPRFDTVSSGMQAQAQAAEQIREAMVQLRETAAHTVRSVEETNGSVAELKSAAAAMAEGIASFRT